MLLSGDETNPILHIEELPRFPWSRPQPVPGAVHVYLSRQDRLYQPAGGFTLGELWLYGPRRLYVVDIAPHHLVRSLDVVSRSTGTTAGLAVSCHWRVRDPAFVVESRLVDVMTVVPELLRSAVTEALSEVSWDNAEQLAEALRPHLLPEHVSVDGIELSGLGADVLSINGAPLTLAGDDG